MKKRMYFVKVRVGDKIEMSLPLAKSKKSLKAKLKKAYKGVDHELLDMKRIKLNKSVINIFHSYSIPHNTTSLNEGMH